MQYYLVVVSSLELGVLMIEQGTRYDLIRGVDRYRYVICDWPLDLGYYNRMTLGNST